MFNPTQRASRVVAEEMGADALDMEAVAAERGFPSLAAPMDQTNGAAAFIL